MKVIQLSENLLIETSTTKSELIDFAKNVIQNELYVEGFSMKNTLLGMILTLGCSEKYSEKVKDSFISLLKFNNNYIGVCCFLEHHPITIQTFVSPEFRGFNYAYSLIEKTIKQLEEFEDKKKITFFKGNEASLVLFYKLWRNKVIKLTNMYDMEDQFKLKYIKNGITGKENKLKFFLSTEERTLLNSYILKHQIFQNLHGK